MKRMQRHDDPKAWLRFPGSDAVVTVNHWFNVIRKFDDPTAVITDFDLKVCREFDDPDALAHRLAAREKLLVAHRPVPPSVAAADRRKRVEERLERRRRSRAAASIPGHPTPAPPTAVPAPAVAPLQGEWTLADLNAFIQANPKLPVRLQLFGVLLKFCLAMNSKNIERNARLDAIEKRLSDVEYRALQIDSSLTSRVRTLEETPRMEYLGLYVSGSSYQPGQFVTHDGHIWGCKVATTIQPGYNPTSAKVWTLAVKAGRPGRDGRDASAR
jgi:hypothetical protein